MAQIGRLAGAILVSTQNEFYLVGNTKVPCDFASAGFEPPPLPVDALERPFIRLLASRRIEIAPPRLLLEVEGEALARLLTEVFLIERTGSVSERLWRLATRQNDEEPNPVADALSARWLTEMPLAIWRIVRDAVLRCS